MFDIQNHNSKYLLLSIIFFLFIIFLFSCSGLETKDKIKIQNIEKLKRIEKDTEHIVKKGETLSKIAIQHYGAVNVGEYIIIADRNNILWPYIINEGQKIIIPPLKKKIFNQSKVTKNSIENEELNNTYNYSKYEYAKKLFKDGKYKEAKNQFENALRSDESCTDCREYKKKCDKAAEIIELIEAKLDEFEPDYNDIIYHYNQLLAINDFDPKGKNGLYNIYFEEAVNQFLLGKYDKAQKKFETSSNYNKTPDVEIYVEKCKDAKDNKENAVKKFKNEQYLDAINKFKYVLTINPDDKDVKQYLSKAYYYYGLKFYNKGDYQKAESNFKSAASIIPSNEYKKMEEKAKNAADAFDLGDEALKIKNYTKAKLEFKKIIKLNPLDEEVHLKLIRTYFENGLFLFNKGISIIDSNNKNYNNHELTFSNISNKFINFIDITKYWKNNQDQGIINNYKYAINEFEFVINYEYKFNKEDYYKNYEDECKKYIDNSIKAKEAFEKGMNLFNDKVYIDAISQFKCILDINNNDEFVKNLLNESYYCLGFSLFKQEDYLNAIEYFQKVQPSHSKYSQSQLFFVKSKKAEKKTNNAFKLSEKNYKESIPFFEEVLLINTYAGRIKQKLNELNFKWGKELFDKGLYNDAEKKFNIANKYTNNNQKKCLQEINKCQKLSTLKNQSMKFFDEANYEKSIELSNNILELNDNDSNARKILFDSYFNIGNTLFNKGEYTKAKKIFIYSNTHFECHECSNIISNCDNAINALSQGEKYMNINEFDKAVEQFKIIKEKLNKNDPNINQYLCKACYNQGLIFFNMGQYEKAIESFSSGESYKYSCQKCTQYIKMCKEAIRVINIAEDSLNDLKNFQRAISNYQKVYKINPKDEKIKSSIIESFFQYGMYFYNKGDYGEAQSKFIEALGYDSLKCPKCYDQLNKCKELINGINDAIEFYNNKKYIEAVNILKKSIDINPNDPKIQNYLYNSYFDLGKLYFSEGQYDKSSQNFKSAINYNNKNYRCDKYIRLCEKADAIIKTGLKYFNQLNYLESIDEFNKIFQYNKSDKKAVEFIYKSYIELGKNLYKSGNYEKSKEYSNSALENNKSRHSITDFKQYRIQLKELISNCEMANSQLIHGIELFNKEEYHNSISVLKSIINRDDKKALNYIEKASSKLFHNSIQKGKEFFQQGNYLKCKDKYEEALYYQRDCKICSGDWALSGIKKCKEVNDLLDKAFDYQKMKKYDQAKIFFQKVYDYNSNDTKANEGIGATTEKMNEIFYKTATQFYNEANYKNAQKKFSEITETYPQFSKVKTYINKSNKAIKLYNEGYDFFKQYKYLKAIEKFKTIIKSLNKEDQNAKKYIHMAYFKIADKSLSQGDYKNAMNNIKQALSYAPNSKKYQKIFDICKKSIKIKKSNSSDKWSQIINLNSKDSEAFYKRGIKFFKQGKYKEAEKDFLYADNYQSDTQQYIEKSKKAYSLLNDSLAYYYNEKYILAINGFQEIIEINRFDNKAKLYLNKSKGFLTFNNMNYTKAKKEFINANNNNNCSECQEYIDKCDNIIELMNAGIKKFNQKDYKNSIKKFEEVLKINPEDKLAIGYIHRAEGHQLFINGGYLNAKIKFESAISNNECDNCLQQINICDLLHKTMNKGREYYDIPKYKKAIKSFEEVLKNNNNDKEAKKYIRLSWMNFGNELFNEKKWNEAIEAYNNYLKLDPKNKQILKNICVSHLLFASFLYKNGDHDNFFSHIKEYKKRKKCDECPNYEIILNENLSKLYYDSIDLYKDKKQKGKLSEALKGFAWIYALDHKYKNVGQFIDKINACLEGLDKIKKNDPEIKKNINLIKIIKGKKHP